MERDEATTINKRKPTHKHQSWRWCWKKKSHLVHILLDLRTQRNEEKSVKRCDAPFFNVKKDEGVRERKNERKEKNTFCNKWRVYYIIILNDSYNSHITLYERTNTHACTWMIYPDNMVRGWHRCRCYCCYHFHYNVHMYGFPRWTNRTERDILCTCVFGCVCAKEAKDRRTGEREVERVWKRKSESESAK